MSAGIEYVNLVDQDFKKIYHVSIGTESPIRKIKQYLRKGIYQISENNRFQRICLEYTSHRYCNCYIKSKKRACSARKIWCIPGSPSKRVLEQTMMLHKDNDILFFINGAYVDDEKKVVPLIYKERVRYIFVFNKRNYIKCNEMICNCRYFI